MQKRHYLNLVYMQLLKSYMLAQCSYKTGNTLEEWLDLVQASRLKTQKASLKDHFQFSTLHATWIVEIAAKEEWGGGSPEAYLEEATKYMDAMFIGSKAGLRPITKLSSLSYQLGKDIRACPCKTIIPLYSHHVFAQIKLSTCIDLGLALSNL